MHLSQLYFLCMTEEILEPGPDENLSDPIKLKFS